MKSPEIRHKFFTFFKKNKHEIVTSSSLIPAQDPTLLFANAGMNQFKDIFLDKEKRSYSRAVTIQKCVRAGGKHNDLDNVGFTKRHLTFFEMMGNFSFGDYFKKEAIQFAWDFLTKEMKLKTDNMHVSVFTTDDESYDIWHRTVGLPKEKIHRLGEAENFWQMGDIGPCGPCTEIHIDRGPKFGCKDASKCGPECECDRFLEVWNLVFMQYDKQPDGQLKELENKGVDTGMGLERLSSIMQNVDSVFETDLFTNIIKKIEELTKLTYKDQPQLLKNAFHVLADHVRSSTMLICDGGAPSNEGRGYVLRKIIRRAALFTQKLTDKNILPELSKVVIQEMSEFYPDIKANEKHVYKILQSEVKKFATNLVRGQHILKQYFDEQKDANIITGAQAFKLYDTYGFPLELIILLARDNAFTVDTQGFEQHMTEQRIKSGSKKMKTDPLDTLDIDDAIQTEFTGYTQLQTDSQIIALIHNDAVVNSVPKGETCFVITRKSPYFIVGGGQVPDEGHLVIDGKRAPLKQVRYINNRIAPQIKAPIDLKVGMEITSVVDPVWRTNAMKNHTATHMLQAALIELFGNTIKQSGSLVHPDYLRFDFTYHENLSPEDITRIENVVNQKIMENIPVTTEYMTMKDALKRGALAFFGDKYNPEEVRLVDIPNFSAELCGGTHVPATGVIGCIKIVEVSALSAGHRRIVAVTGPKALELFQESFNTVKSLSQEFSVQKDQVADAVLKQKELIKDLQKEVKQLRADAWRAQLPQWRQETQTINGMPFLFVHTRDMDAATLREIVNTLAHETPGMYFGINEDNDRTMFMCYRSANFSDRVNLKKFSTWLKDKHGLRGGGGGDTLQGGGGKFDASLKDAIIGWLQKQ